MKIIRDIVTALFKLVYLKVARYPRIAILIEDIVFTTTPGFWTGVPRFETWLRSKQYTNNLEAQNKEPIDISFKEGEECIVVIDYAAPQYDRDAGSRTLSQWMQIFSDTGMDVKFLPQNCLFDPVYGEYMRKKMMVSTVYGKSCGNFKKWMKKNGHMIDYFFLSRPHVSIGYIKTIKKFSNAKVIYYGHDIHFLRLKKKIETGQSSKILKHEMHAISLIEKDIWRQADVVYYPSDTETEYVNRYLAQNKIVSKAETVPVYAFNSHFEKSFCDLNLRSGILFVGGFSHAPNEDGVLWMMEHVMPIVWQSRPNVRVYLVGSNPTKKIKEICSNKVEVTGYVSDQDLERYYKCSRVAVAPLTYGAGVKGKVVESMRYGLPIVTTSIGSQGLSHVEEALLVADLPGQYAQHVIDLLANDRQWTDISNRQINLVDKYFSVQATQKQFAKHISSLRVK